MVLAKSQKYLVVGIVVVLVAAIAAGAWYLSGDAKDQEPNDEDDNDQEPGKNAMELANRFVDNYTGSFGPFQLNSTSTSGHAVVMKENDSDRLRYSKINYTIASDAQSQFNQIKSKIESMEGFMGGTPTEIQGIAGFDEICAYKMDIRMGTMTQFTLIYFVAYTDGVLVDASEDPLYHSGSLATESEITEFFEAVSASLSP